jgi:site-specific DNA-methyltransferase (adenine-specific)
VDEVISPYFQSDTVTLYNADCLEVMPTFAAGSIDAVITDPPYGIGYDGQEWDDKFDYLPFITKLHNEFCAILLEGGLCFAWMPKNELYKLGIADFDFDIFIETKNFAQMRPHNILIDCWVPVLMFSNGKPRRIKKNGMGKNWFMINTANTNRNSKNNPRNICHPTVKDASIIRYFIELSTKKGEIILDPFMGSGTTGVACVQTGRKFIGIEISKDYCDIAVKRIRDAEQQMRLF